MTKLTPGQTLIFIGDSITESDRRIAAHGPLGWGYVRMLSDMLITHEPGKPVNIINKGVNGNTIKHLLSRWQDDVIEQQPDQIFILIGINDATRCLDHSPSLHCEPVAYRNTYVQLIEETRTRLPACTIALMQPFLVSRGDDIKGSYRNELSKLMPAYIDCVDELACRYELPLVPLQETFQKLLRHRKSDVFSEDKIHPNLTGHYAIADAVYRSLQTTEQ